MFKDPVSRKSRASELSELSPAFLVANALSFHLLRFSSAELAWDFHGRRVDSPSFVRRCRT